MATSVVALETKEVVVHFMTHEFRKLVLWMIDQTQWLRWFWHHHSADRKDCSREVSNSTSWWVISCVNAFFPRLTLWHKGQSGFGKSTPVNTIASHLIESKGRVAADVPPRQTTEIEAVSHDNRIMCFCPVCARTPQTVISENVVQLKLNIIDTPGYGDQVNNENWYVRQAPSWLRRSPLSTPPATILAGNQLSNTWRTSTQPTFARNWPPEVNPISTIGEYIAASSP